MTTTTPAEVLVIRADLPRPARGNRPDRAHEVQEAHDRVLDARQHQGLWCLIRIYRSSNAAREAAVETFPGWFPGQPVEFAHAPSGEAPHAPPGVWCRWTG